MTELVGILALPALLIIVGILFVAQYKLANKERKWMMLIIPAVILATFIIFSTLAIQAKHSYEVRMLEGMDGHGNILKMTIQEPKDGDLVTIFSGLMVYNKDKVLVDELHLYYKDNKPEMVGNNLAYDAYIQDMLNGIRLDGSSWGEELTMNRVPFMGLTFEGNIHKALAFIFGIPFILILFAGILPRFVNRKKIRAMAIAKVDIQSLDNGE
jgi:hypothetical protein